MNEARIVVAKKQTSQWLEIFSRNLLYALALLVLAGCYLQYRVAGWAWIHWDLMLISGLLAFMIALSGANHTGQDDPNPGTPDKARRLRAL